MRRAWWPSTRISSAVRPLRAPTSSASRSSSTGPYFGVVQDSKYYEYAQKVPGPLTERFAALAQEHHMVVILPVYEEENTGVLYNTAAVIDADGSYLGKYRKNHIPHVDRFWEKFYFRPGNLGCPCSTPRSARSV